MSTALNAGRPGGDPRHRIRLGAALLLLLAVLLLVRGLRDRDPCGTDCGQPPVAADTVRGPASEAMAVAGPRLPVAATVSGTVAEATVLTGPAAERARPAPARRDTMEAAAGSAAEPATSGSAASVRTTNAPVAPAAPGPDRSATDDHAYEEGMFELVIEEVPGRPMLVVLVDARGEVFVPLREVAAHAEIPLTQVGGELTLEWPPEIWETVLDLDAGTLRMGGAEPRPLDGAHVVRERELYLSAAALGSLLHAEVRVLWSDLMIRMVGPQFPVVKRLRREAARPRRAGTSSGFGADPYGSLPFEARTGAGAATWGLYTSKVQGGDVHGSGRLALGASVLGGATEVSATAAFGSPGSDGIDDLAVRFSRPVYGTPWLRKVELGSVVAGGSVSHRLIGATLGNDPYNQPRYFDETAILPAVPAGWEYEVYQGEYLVGVSDGLSGDAIEAPLNYGNTAVRVRLLGPAGQEIVEDLLYVVNPRQVPTGEWRYDVGAGVCRDDYCESHASANLRYGARPWLTLGAGVEHLAMGGARGNDLGYHGSLLVKPRPDMSADLQIRPGSFVQASAQYQPSRSGMVSGSYTWNRPDTGGFGFRGWQGQLSGSGLLSLPGGARNVTGHVFLRGRETADVDAWRVGLSVPFGRTFATAGLESGLQANDLLTLGSHTSIGSPKGWLRDLAVNAAFAVSAERAEMLEAGLSFRPAPWGTVQAGIRFRQGTDPRFSLTFSSRGPVAFTQSRAVVSDRSSVSLSVDGGAALGDGLGGATFFPLPGTGQAGIAGLVFIDVNGNGVQDADEPAAGAGVPVMVDGRRLVTGEGGAFRTWNVRPYEAVVVAVDSLGVDFNLKPDPGLVVLRPSPNVFNRVDLPLLRTRELVGRVETSDGRPLGGVTVEVLDERGAVVVAARTFSDGELYLQRVPAGMYTLRVAEGSLRALDATARDVSVRVPSGGDDVVEVPVLRLEVRR